MTVPPCGLDQLPSLVKGYTVRLNMDRASSVATPRLWNILPLKAQLAASL